MTVSSLSVTESAAQNINEFARRCFLPVQHNCLWQIETGVVRTLTSREDGTSIALGLWGPGDIVGKVLSKTDSYRIECLTPVQARLLPKDRWCEATEAMVLHIQRCGELMEILHCRQGDMAILRLFTWLAKRFGREIEQGQLIELRLTHQDIAELTGLTRTTVTRLLSELEEQGIIQRLRRHVIVLQDQLPFWHYEI